MDVFYSTIFVAVLALFGLLVAALLFTAQTIGDRYSTKIAQRVLRGRRSVTFWFFGVLTLLMSSAALVSLAFPPRQAWRAAEILERIPKNPAYGLLTLLAVFLTLVFFWITLRRYSDLMSPVGALEELGRDLDARRIRDIAILRVYQPPMQVQLSLDGIAQFLRGEHTDMPALESGTIETSVPTKPDARPIFAWAPRLKARLKSAKLSTPEAIKARLARVERLGKLEDPLADIFEYALLAVEKNNVVAWKSALRRIVSPFLEGTQEGMLADGIEVPFLADQLLVQWLERAAAEIQASQRRSFILDLCAAVEEVSAAFVASSLWERLDGFLGFFQRVGAQAVQDVDALSFRYPMTALTRIGTACVVDDRTANNVFEDVCRKVGWLGEKLILRGIEDAPLMPSWSETKELNEVTEAIYKLSDAVCRAEVEKYPIILKDAIEVICQQILGRNEPGKFWETMVHLLGFHRDLAQNLIARESANAPLYLSSTLHFLKEVLKNYDLSDYRELKGDIFHWVRTLAQEALAHNRPASDVWVKSNPKDLVGMIMDFVADVGNASDWSGAMHELVIKCNGHHDEAWRFVKRAGVALQSNFGLMFDPMTGLDYAEDDPRRR